MRHAIAFILVSLAAAIIGIGSAWFTLQGDLKFQKIAIGQWNIWPKAAVPSADPYTKAYLARAGKTWMSTTEGLAFFSTQDSKGEHYASNCEYKLTGIIPRGRLWTLSYIETSKQKSITKPAYITSDDVIWNEDNQLEIYISKTAQPGNWLPLTTKNRFSLALRIYDTPLTSGALDAAIKTPLIERVGCT